MQTEIARAISPNEQRTAVERAVALLRAHEIVALPTETVYGLAADALSGEAVAKIFEAKERPKFDPLIVHLPDREWLQRVTRIEEENQRLIQRLVDSFWPGPLTMVLPRAEIVPELVTAGLATVAVRMSAHPIFRQVVDAFGQPLAAPSANRFGRISPTSAADVMEELSGRIPLIVDGGPTDHGIESTVIAPRGHGIAVLRPGPVTSEELAKFGRVVTGASGKTESPGQLPSHYRPRTPLIIVEDITAVSVPPGKRYGALLWSSAPFSEAMVESRRLSPGNDLREAAANLFRYLRELDRAGLDLIVAEAVPEQGLGIAIMDRLRRAAHR